MKRYPIIILFLFILSTCLVYPQGKEKKKAEKETAQEIFDDAEYFYESEDFKEALYDYLKLHDLKPYNANINYHIGACYLGIPGEEKKAVPYLEEAVTKISTKYNKSTYEETRAPLVAMFSLGTAYRIDNQLTKAVEILRKFQSNKFVQENYNQNVIDQEIEAAERAKTIQDNPVNIRRTNLGEPVNNSSSNYKAVVDQDETILIYLNSLKFYNAIYMSRKENGVWSEPVNISPQVGSDGNCDPTCISSNGKELYFVKNVKGNSDIYVSYLKDSLWSPMIALNKNINSSRNETHASISADGKTLYFSSDRRGGFGKLDIYKSEKDANGNWGPAINLGEKINTEYNENIPFICEDGKTLYFSSEGHLNMGGYDVFVSHLRPGNQWEDPINAGFPINTTGNDLFYLPIKNGKAAYYSLILPEGFGKEDIYKIENMTVKAQERTINGQKSKVKKIIVRDKITRETLGILQYDEEADSIRIQQANDRIMINIDQ